VRPWHRGRLNSDPRPADQYRTDARTPQKKASGRPYRLEPVDDAERPWRIMSADDKEVFVFTDRDLPVALEILARLNGKQ
jgi:hypothetical protein